LSEKKITNNTIPMIFAKIIQKEIFVTDWHSSDEDVSVGHNTSDYGISSSNEDLQTLRIKKPGKSEKDKTVTDDSYDLKVKVQGDKDHEDEKSLKISTDKQTNGKTDVNLNAFDTVLWNLSEDKDDDNSKRNKSKFGNQVNLSLVQSDDEGIEVVDDVIVGIKEHLVECVPEDSDLPMEGINDDVKETPLEKKNTPLQESESRGLGKGHSEDNETIFDRKNSKDQDNKSNTLSFKDWKKMKNKQDLFDDEDAYGDNEIFGKDHTGKYEHGVDMNETGKSPFDKKQKKLMNDNERDEHDLYKDNVKKGDTNNSGTDIDDGNDNAKSNAKATKVSTDENEGGYHDDGKNRTDSSNSIKDSKKKDVNVAVKDGIPLDDLYFYGNQYTKDQMLSSEGAPREGEKGKQKLPDKDSKEKGKRFADKDDEYSDDLYLNEGGYFDNRHPIDEDKIHFDEINSKNADKFGRPSYDQYLDEANGIDSEKINLDRKRQGEVSQETKGHSDKGFEKNGIFHADKGDRPSDDQYPNESGDLGEGKLQDDKYYVGAFDEDLYSKDKKPPDDKYSRMKGKFYSDKENKPSDSLCFDDGDILGEDHDSKQRRILCVDKNEKQTEDMDSKNKVKRFANKDEKTTA